MYKTSLESCYLVFVIPTYTLKVMLYGLGQSQPSDTEHLLYSLLSLPEALTLESLLCLCGI